ncbi:MAG: T9SS type A sorting domain-containing protein, partial [Ignavibacteria bacterium]|nr:T9SS type A sorting domain-containing protein [Ignavibacteria bacterium]
YAARESINSPNGYQSSDNGITWSNLNGLSFFNTITFHSEPGKLFAGTIHGAWISTNNGLNWIHRIAGLSPDPYNSAFIRVNGILITSLKFGGSGMYRSSNDGELWENFDQGLPFLSSIDDLVLFNNRILAAASDGIYQRNISDLTGLSTLSGEIPGSFSLEQNYPNPFNPATKFRFSIPASAGSDLNVRAEIFDITGKQSGILFNSAVTAGTYEAAFDGTGYSSGIYFYKLSVYSGGNKLLYSEVKKMSLVK